MSEEKVGLMSKVWKGLTQNRLIQAEKENLTSVRTKLTYMLAGTWLYVNMFILTSIFQYVKGVDYATKLSLIDKALAIFYVDSFIFLIMILVYVLKRTNFVFKAWGIELDLSDNGTSKQQDDKVIKQGEVK